MSIFPPFRRVGTVLATYGDRLSAFSPNARLYLANLMVSGAAMGVYRLLFNFYVLSLGYDEALLGTLVTASSLSAMLAALPMGYLVNYLGRRNALVLGGALLVAAIGGQVLAPSAGMFIAMNLLLGLAQALSGVTMGPFLMENSSEKERTYLFSFASGFQMGSVSVGNWIGGYLPTWMAGLQGSEPISTAAYGLSLGVVTLVGAAALVPLLLMRAPRGQASEVSLFAPFAYFKTQPRLLGRLILPLLATSLGAGLIMPFMNVFFRQVHHQPDPAIGAMFAWGSLAMGIGLMLAPPLADRFGKVQFVVITQALSIPFLVMLGYAPWYPAAALAYYLRLALMNMSGPVYQTFVMEKVEPSARGTVASLVSMTNSFGWAFSPTISGWIQVNWGFGPAFAGTIVLYVLSTYLYWRYFWYAGAKETRRKGSATFSPQLHPKK